MVLIRDHIKGDQDIRGHTSLIGQISGCVTVFPGVHLVVRGLITGQLILQPGSFIVVYGRVHGDIQNEGGTLKVYGQVDGTITTPTGNTLIDPGARLQCW